VHFKDGSTDARAANATYRLSDEALLLSGGGPPRVVQERMSVEAVTIDMKLAAEQISAKGAVKSELKPRAENDTSGARLPGLLNDDQPVNVTAETLVYDGSANTATYGGGVRLWQPTGDETAIKSQTLTLDEKSGNLTADGQVLTDVTLDQIQEGGKKERVKTTARAERLVYEDASRRAVYTGAAQVAGTQGTLLADRVEVYLLPEGRELERMEADSKVNLATDGRKATGSHVTYLASDQSYKVVGLPAVVRDACRQAEGRTVTFFRSTDRMIVDGNEVRRASASGTTGCQ
jgi:lipopolysaccharide export system protein LptA